MNLAFKTGIRQWCYLLVAITIAFVTGLVCLQDEKGRASIDLSMNGSRVLYGLTVATSHYSFGTPLYSYYEPVFDAFFTKQTMKWSEVNALITKARGINPKTLTPEKLHIGFGELDEDDKGVLVWYTAAFELFGPYLASIYLVYFMLLAGSLTLFWLAFREDEAALILMVLYALTHLALASFALTGNTNVIGSLLGTRPFSMLAVLPTLHLALLIVRQRPPSRWLVAGAAAQIVFLLFVMAVRSSANIQMLLIFLVAACMFGWRAWCTRNWRILADIRQAFTWVPLALLIGLGCYKVAYNASIPAELREKALTGHLVWYPALAGFVLNQTMHTELYEFSKIYKAPPTVDTGIYDANGKLRKDPSPDALARISVIGYALSILGEDISPHTVGGPDRRDTHLYERYAKRFFFFELAKHPGEMMRLYAVDKTKNLLAMLNHVLWKLQSCDILISAFLLGLIGGAVWLRALYLGVPLLIGGFAVSSIPAYWFVPATHTMYDYAPYFYLGFLGIITTAGAILSAKIKQRFSARRLQSLLPLLALAGIPLLAGAALLAVRYPSASSRSTIIVTSATYGENLKAPRGNATEKLRHACNGRSHCAYTVDVNVLGDPATGAGKNFAVEYQCSYELKPIRYTIEAEAHNKKALLDCRN